MSGQDKELRKSSIPIPHGFQELLTSLAKEVLRAQPEDVYEFSALFFQVFLSARKEGHGEEILSDPVQYKRFKSILFTEASNRSLLGANAFIKPSSFLVSSVGDGSGVKSDVSKDISGDVVALEKGRENETETEAATRIQAAFRGFKTRKTMLQPSRKVHLHQNEIETVISPKFANEEVIGATQHDVVLEEQILTQEHAADLSPQDPDSLDHSPAYEHASLVNSPEEQGKFAESPVYHRPSFGDEDDYASPPLDQLSPLKERADEHPFQTHDSPLEEYRDGVQGSSGSEVSSPLDDVAASKIQAGVRGYLTRKHVNQMKEEETRAATKIQAVYKGFTTRKHMEGLSGSSHSPRSGEDFASPEMKASPDHHGKYTIESPTSPANEPPEYNGNESFEMVSHDDFEPAHDGIDHSNYIVEEQMSREEGGLDESADEAATKIQSAFRSHLAQKEFEEERNAAIKIQSVYRGYHTRKEFGGAKD